MNVNEVVLGFRRFLNESMPSIIDLTAQSDGQASLGDWMQANWELLVEANVLNTNSGEYLDIYGEGADCSASSSRVWQPEALPTHKIICRSKDGRSIYDILTGDQISQTELDFDQFVSWNGEKYGEKPPFDFVLLNNEKDILVVNLDELVFDKVPYDR